MAVHHCSSSLLITVRMSPLRNGKSSASCNKTTVVSPLEAEPGQTIAPENA